MFNVAFFRVNPSVINLLVSPVITVQTKVFANDYPYMLTLVFKSKDFFF